MTTSTITPKELQKAISSILHDIRNGCEPTENTFIHTVSHTRAAAEESTATGYVVSTGTRMARIECFYYVKSATYARRVNEIMVSYHNRNIFTLSGGNTSVQIREFGYSNPITLDFNCTEEELFQYSTTFLSNETYEAFIQAKELFLLMGPLETMRFDSNDIKYFMERRNAS